MIWREEKLEQWVQELDLYTYRVPVKTVYYYRVKNNSKCFVFMLNFWCFWGNVNLDKDGGGS
jgi:hypothetical protein